jgi:hypothetical protein
MEQNFWPSPAAAQGQRLLPGTTLVVDVIFPSRPWRTISHSEKLTRAEALNHNEQWLGCDDCSKRNSQPDEAPCLVYPSRQCPYFLCCARPDSAMFEAVSSRATTIYEGGPAGDYL